MSDMNEYLGYDEEMVEFWINKFIADEGEKELDQITTVSILIEIDEINGTIDNEKLASLATIGEDCYHDDNIKNLVVYKERLVDILKERGVIFNANNKDIQGMSQ